VSLRKVTYKVTAFRVGIEMEFTEKLIKYFVIVQLDIRI